MVAMPRLSKNCRKVARPASFTRFDFVSAKRGKVLLDRQARRYLNMSGAQFKAAYEAGEIPDPDRTDVIRVALLLPFAEG